MTITCKSATRDGRIVVLSPSVGLWCGRPAMGQVLGGGQSIGTIDVLGRRHRIVLPGEAKGAVVGGLTTDPRVELPVDYGAELLHLDPEVGGATLESAAGPGASASTGLGFPSPSSGRFWRRPSPSDPPLVAEGQTIRKGQPVGLLEVMKTFTRLAYDGPGLPDTARVVRILPADGDDVDAGDILVELEPE